MKRADEVEKEIQSFLRHQKAMEQKQQQKLKEQQLTQQRQQDPKLSLGKILTDKQHSLSAQIERIHKTSEKEDPPFKPKRQQSVALRCRPPQRKNSPQNATGGTFSSQGGQQKRRRFSKSRPLSSSLTESLIIPVDNLPPVVDSDPETPSGSVPEDKRGVSFTPPPPRKSRPPAASSSASSLPSSPSSSEPPSPSATTPITTTTTPPLSPATFTTTPPISPPISPPTTPTTPPPTAPTTPPTTPTSPPPSPADSHLSPSLLSSSSSSHTSGYAAYTDMSDELQSPVLAEGQKDFEKKKKFDFQVDSYGSLSEEDDFDEDSEDATDEEEEEEGEEEKERKNKFKNSMYRTGDDSNLADVDAYVYIDVTKGKTKLPPKEKKTTSLYPVCEADCYSEQPDLLPSSPKKKKKKKKSDKKSRQERKKEKETKTKKKKLADMVKDRSLRWCEAFHTVTSCLREEIKETLDCGTQGYDKEEVLLRQITEYWKLYQVSREFTNTANHYGSIIISERYSEKKTIAPVSIGGVAGGEKYMAQGILFKFATAENGLYVNEHAAAKVAGHELQGCLTYFNCLTFLGRRNVRVPLMALIDYCGYRLVAISLLPIGKGTLIYGTCDAGRTVYNSAPDFDLIMEECGKNLNLEKHICGANPNENFRQTLHTAADVEGHQGFDDRFYLVDFSRVLPPVVPDPKLPGSQLFRMFRQEFVSAYENNPLCSDAFSGFTRYDPERTEQNQHIREATKNLIELKVPDFARRLTWVLMEAREKGELVAFNLPQALHREGINLRYLGVILEQYVKDGREETLLAQYYVLTCMLARTFKNEIRKLLRKVLLKQKYAEETIVRTTIIGYLNLILLEKPQQAKNELTATHRIDYMKKTIIPLMKKWFLFAGSLPKGVKKPDVFVKLCHVGTPVLGTHPAIFVLSFIESQLSISFSKLAAPKILVGQPLSETDIFSISARVKHMNVVAAAMGGYCRNAAALYSSDKMRQTQDALELLKTGNKHYLEGLQSTPKNLTLLKGAAQGLLQLFVLQELQKDVVNRHEIPPYQDQYDEIDRTIVLNSKDPIIRQVDDYFREAFDLKRESSLCCDYALFLWQSGRISKAEEFFLRCLEENPFNVRGLLSYSDYLKKKEDRLFEKSHQLFLKRAESLSKVAMVFLSPSSATLPELGESSVPSLLSWAGMKQMEYKLIFWERRKKDRTEKGDDNTEEKEPIEKKKNFIYYSARTKLRRFLIDLASIFSPNERVIVNVKNETETSDDGGFNKLVDDVFGKKASPIFIVNNDPKKVLDWTLVSLAGDNEQVVETSSHFLGATPRGRRDEGTIGRSHRTMIL